MDAVRTDSRTRVIRASRTASFRPVLLLLLSLAGLPVIVAPPSLWLTAGPETEPSPAIGGETLLDVRVEGNTTIPTEHIAKYIHTRPGRPYSQKQIQDDVKSLFGTKWFFSVEPRFRRTKRGLVLVYHVIERPVVRRVEYKGNKEIADKHLAKITGLKPGSPFVVSANRESVRRMTKHYREKGFAFAKIELEKGGDRDDRDVIFRIDEGPKVRVGSVKFTGNEFVSSAVLLTKIRTKRAILWMFGGLYDPSTVSDDITALKQYYFNLGFFDVDVTHEKRFNKSRSLVTFIYHIKEGPRYKIRRVEFRGNRQLSDEDIHQDLELCAGDYFNARHLTNDIDGIKEKYGRMGRLFANVEAAPRFLESEAGIADLVYRIDEDRVYRIRRVNIVFRDDLSHTKRSVVLNRMLIHPGDLANPKLIRRSETRLRGTQIFASGRQNPGTAPNIVVRRVRPDDAQPSDTVRGQSGDNGFTTRGSRSTSARRRQTTGHRTAAHATRDEVDPAAAHPSSGLVSRRSLGGKSAGKSAGLRRSLAGQSARPLAGRVVSAGGNPFDISNLNPDGTEKRSSGHRGLALSAGASPSRMSSPSRIASPSRSVSRSRSVARSRIASRWQTSTDDDPLPFTNGAPPAFYVKRSRSRQIRGQNYDRGIEQPGSPLYNADPNDPLGSAEREGDVDLDVQVSETQTGRLMFGVGVNSDAGVVGSIVLNEFNFDILRFPRSFQDIRDGLAWRGGGQRFRLEAVPGNEVSRFLVSWTDPYFLNTNYSLGFSGFFFNRFFEDWDEERTGGRVQVGRQWTPALSTTGTFRIENVRLTDPDEPTPRIVAEAEGDNTLLTLGITVAHDTRDQAFMPGEGHLLEFTAEQAVGEFDFPKLILSGSQFFTVYQRPDGLGRHILTLKGQLGWTDVGTPVFERFFAGGFQTFRGFDFRGVTPRVNDIEIGGRWMALGTVEYMLPLLANETLQGVAFTDFGTVENDVGLEEFRLSLGVGLRITIPAMGPVPLAFDFAFPVLEEDFDDERVFNFFVGINR